MPECVSCGKQVPEGRLFCDDCYKNMKGKRGPGRQTVRNRVQPEKRATDSIGHQGALQGLPPEQPRQNDAAGTLTPTSSKKIVSLKPAVEKGSREKEKSPKKKFSVTITMSERTYRAVGRLKGKSKKLSEAETQAGESATAKTKTRRRRKSTPYGRSKLKAVEVARKRSQAGQNRVWKAVGYRERPLDGQDRVAIITATFTASLIVALSFLGWMSVRWISEAGAVNQQVNVKGSDFGILFYVLITVAVLSWLYMAGSLYLRKLAFKIDFGVILMLGGIASIIIVFIALAWHTQIINIALHILEKAGNNIPPDNALYERQTMWPAYLLVLMGAAMAFAGLIRLSTRQDSASQKKS
jgi:hypothetical protein